MGAFYFWVALIGAVTWQYTLATGSFTFELPDNEKMCFYQEFNSSSRMIFEYSVIKGGQNDVDTSIESPNGNILYKETKKKEDEHEFETSRGTFTFCFSNEFSTFTHKVIYFELRPEVKDPLAVQLGDKRPTANTHMEESMETVHQNTRKVMEVQTDYRLNEARGRHRAEELNKRVQWWSIGQALVIMCSGLGQVFVLKTFFTDKRDLAVSPAKPL